MKKRFFGFALAIVTMFVSACSGTGGVSKSNDAADMSEEITLQWYFPCANHPDTEMVFEQANQILKEKLNLTVDFSPVEFGSYEQKMQIINAGRGDYDVCFTSNWLNNYYTNVERESFVDITDMLPQYAPGLYEEISEKYWDGAKINDRIYAVINQQIMARQTGFAVPKPLVEEFNINMDEINTIADFEPYLRKIVAKYPQCNQLTNSWEWASLGLFGFESVFGDETPPVIRLNAELNKYEVINQYETQEYKDYIQLRSRWHAEGLTKESLLTDSEKSGAVMRGGKLYQPFRILSTYKPGVETEDAIANGVEFVYKKIGAPILTSSGVTSTLNAVSATSRYPERALQMLNLMNTDKELFNTVYLGLEGIHYTKIGENKVKQSETNRFSPAAWVLGNQFNAYILDGQADDVWEETKKLNDEAQLSPLYGFLPDTKKISVQLASCKSVVGEYKTALGEGVGDTDQLYSEFIAKLDAAGVNTLIDELQTQIDAWVAKK